jgi:hypothetical protein
LWPAHASIRGAVNREVFIAEQALSAGLFDHGREKAFCDLALEQPLAVLENWSRPTPGRRC